MIDTKEKLKHCLNIERKIYFPRGDEDSFRHLLFITSKIDAEQVWYSYSLKCLR